MCICFYKVADYSVRISKIAKAENLEIGREIFISEKKVLINQYKNYISVSLYYATQKSSFPLRISSVNMTKSAVFCGFSHIN